MGENKQRVKYIMSFMILVLSFLFYVAPIYAQENNQEVITKQEEPSVVTETKLKTTDEQELKVCGESYDTTEAAKQEVTSWEKAFPKLEKEEDSEAKAIEEVKRLCEGFKARFIMGILTDYTTFIQEVQTEVVKISEIKILNPTKSKTSETTLPKSDDIKVKILYSTEPVNFKVRGCRDCLLIPENFRAYSIETSSYEVNAVFCAMQKQERWITRKESLF